MNSPYLLLVEDNPDDAFIMRRVMRKTGLDLPMHVVNDGKEAVDFFREIAVANNPEEKPLPLVVFLDLKLPYLNGFEVLGLVRQDPVLRDLNVVILTSSAEERDGKRAEELGVTTYLVKPPKPEDLLKTIRPVLDQASHPETSEVEGSHESPRGH